jgi:hypothetical protein
MSQSFEDPCSSQFDWQKCIQVPNSLRWYKLAILGRRTLHFSRQAVDLAGAHGVEFAPAARRHPQFPQVTDVEAAEFLSVVQTGHRNVSSFAQCVTVDEIEAIMQVVRGGRKQGGPALESKIITKEHSSDLLAGLLRRL